MPPSKHPTETSQPGKGSTNPRDGDSESSRADKPEERDPMNRRPEPSTDDGFGVGDSSAISELQEAYNENGALKEKLEYVFANARDRALLYGVVGFAALVVLAFYSAALFDALKTASPSTGTKLHVLFGVVAVFGCLFCWMCVQFIRCAGILIMLERARRNQRHAMSAALRLMQDGVIPLDTLPIPAGRDFWRIR